MMMMGFGGGCGKSMRKCRCKNEEIAAGQSHARTPTSSYTSTVSVVHATFHLAQLRALLGWVARSSRPHTRPDRLSLRQGTTSKYSAILVLNCPFRANSSVRLGQLRGAAPGGCNPRHSADITAFPHTLLTAYIAMIIHCFCICTPDLSMPSCHL
jgi:hypothetical protein